MTKHISDLKFDQTNPRKHNPRNLQVTVDSLQKVGFARSIVIDEDDNILAGNGVTEAATLVGIENVVEVEADGNTIVAVRRRGLTDEQKTLLKYYDNRSSELADWDPERILADVQSGFDFGAMFQDSEIVDLVNQIGEGLEASQAVNDPNQEWRGMPEFENNDVFGAVATLKVHFASQEALREFSSLMGQNVNDRTPYIWFPRQQKENLKQYQVIDEP